MPAIRWNVTPNSSPQRLWLPPGSGAYEARFSSYQQPETDQEPDAEQDLTPAVTRQLLRNVVEGEIIPRLLLGCAGGADDETIDAFTTLLQQPDASAAIRMVEDATDAGVSLETMFLDLFTPAARRLGTMWEDDRADFVTVTAASLHLQQVLMHVAPAFRQERAKVNQTHSALLTVVPGGQHTFGVMMLSEFFRREGWQVQSTPCDHITDLIRVVRRNWLSMVGLSIGSNELLDSADQCIRALRKCARNRGMLIMVGGPAINADPSLVSRLGADFTAADGRQAVIQAVRLLRTPAVSG